jgi:putative ABC transport system substrate-binding protein
MNRRRKMLIAVSAVAVTTPLSVFSQAQSTMPRIGFFYLGSRQSAIETGRYNAFVQGMRELGYIDGKNLAIQSRYADGNPDRLPALAAELIRANVNVIVATGAPTYRALQHTTTIPVVITVGSDPVREGWAASMAKPGGHITGLTSTAADAGPKLLELLMALIPNLARIAVMVHPDNAGHPPQLKKIMSVAQKVGIQVMLAETDTAQGIGREFAMLAKHKVGAVVLLNDTFFVEQLREFAAQSLKHRIPSISSLSEYAELGGVMSYGPDLVENFRRAAGYVDKILKGSKPGELPIEQPARYRLAVNRKTAKALGLTFPQTIMVSADKVIE